MHMIDEAIRAVAMAVARTAARDAACPAERAPGIMPRAAVTGSCTGSDMNSRREAIVRRGILRFGLIL